MATPNPQAQRAPRSRISRTANYWKHATFPRSRYEAPSALPSRRTYRWNTPHTHPPGTRLHTFRYPAAPAHLRGRAATPDSIPAHEQPFSTWERATSCAHLVDVHTNRDKDPAWCARCADARRAVDGLRDAAAKMRVVGGPGPYGGTVWWEEDDDDDGEGAVILVASRQALRYKPARRAWDEARMVVGNLREQAWEDGVSIERALEGADELVGVFSGRVDFTGEASVCLDAANGPDAMDAGDESKTSSRLGWCVEFKGFQQHRMPIAYRSDVEFQRSAPQYKPGLWAGDWVDTSGMIDGFKDEEVENDASARELFKAGGLGSLSGPPYIGSVARMPTATRKRKWVEED